MSISIDSGLLKMWELLLKGNKNVEEKKKNCTSIQCFAHVSGQSMVCQ